MYKSFKIILRKEEDFNLLYDWARKSGWKITGNPEKDRLNQPVRRRPNYFYFHASGDITSGFNDLIFRIHEYKEETIESLGIKSSSPKSPQPRLKDIVPFGILLDSYKDKELFQKWIFERGGSWRSGSKEILKYPARKWYVDENMEISVVSSPVHIPPHLFDYPIKTLEDLISPEYKKESKKEIKKNPEKKLGTVKLEFLEESKLRSKTVSNIKKAWVSDGFYNILSKDNLVFKIPMTNIILIKEEYHDPNF